VAAFTIIVLLNLTFSFLVLVFLFSFGTFALLESVNILASPELDYKKNKVGYQTIIIYRIHNNMEYLLPARNLRQDPVGIL
jgi:hypothetical protein